MPLNYYCTARHIQFQPVELDVRDFLALCAAFYLVISERPCLLSNGVEMIVIDTVCVERSSGSGAMFKNNCGEM